MTLGSEFIRKQQKIDHVFVIDQTTPQAAITATTPAASNASIKASSYGLLQNPVSYEIYLDFPLATLNTLGTNSNLETLKSMRGSKFILDLKGDYGIMTVGGNFVSTISFKDLQLNYDYVDTDILWINPVTNKIVFRNIARAINTKVRMQINNLKNPHSFEQQKYLGSSGSKVHVRYYANFRLTHLIEYTYPKEFYPKRTEAFIPLTSTFQITSATVTADFEDKELTRILFTVDVSQLTNTNFSSHTERIEFYFKTDSRNSLWFDSCYTIQDFGDSQCICSIIRSTIEENLAVTKTGISVGGLRNLLHPNNTLKVTNL